MDDYEKDFYRRKAKVKAFENDLKAVFEKHNVKLKEEYEAWHGGGKDIIEVHVDGEHWINYNFDELLTEIKVIE